MARDPGQARPRTRHHVGHGSAPGPRRPDPGGTMNDALGGAQSVLVLGGGSEIALATVHKLIEGRCRSVTLAGRDSEALQAPAKELEAVGATTVDVVAFDGLDFASHDGFVRDVFDRADDFDLVILAFGVLGDQ